MEININNYTRQLAAVDFIKQWKPNPSNSAKNPADDIAWRAEKIRDMLKLMDSEAEAVKQLLDCDVQIKNRPKNLPSIDRVYGLLKADNAKRRNHYNRIINTFQDRFDVWSEVNQMDAHIYAATLDRFTDKKQENRFEPGIENYKLLKRIDNTDESFWKKLDEHTKYHDYQAYYNKRLVKHEAFNPEVDKLPDGANSYRVFAYLGRMTDSHRPLFAMLYITHSTGDIKADLSKLPSKWKPIYIALPQVKPDTRGGLIVEG